ncbi:MAG TPA: tetratricopeptide repeat protein [Terriglobales bacterium]|nr:tetratricopeptide repeat protein [Terriglobales bacterium]
MKKCIGVSVVFLLAAAAAAQQKSAPSSQTPAAKAASESTPSGAPANTTPSKPDRAAAYYHYSMAHIYEELVQSYGRSDLANKAIDEYRAAISDDPSSEYLNNGLAELYWKTGRIRDAVLEAQDLLKRDPNNLAAHKLLGRIYLRSLGDMQSGTQSQNVLKLAIEQYQEIVKLEPNNVEGHLLLGRLYRLDNDMVKAESEFKTAIKLQPDSEEALTTLAYLYNDEGDANRAIQTLSSIPESERSAKLYSALGYTYEEQKDFKNAITAYRKAVALDHDNLDAMRGLAQNLLNDGQLDAALSEYKTIADANPEDPQTYLNMSDIYRRTGQFNEALDSLQKASSMVQDSVEVPYRTAVIYEIQGRYDDAAQVLQDLLKKTEKPDGNYSSGERNNRAIFVERLGSVYRDQNNVPLAIETFRKMLPLGDDNAKRAYQEMIDTYRDAKQWQQATAVAKEASTRLPQDRDLRLVLDSQLADQGQPDQALADVRSMLKGTPADREIYIALAQMYSRLKRWPDAEQAIEKATQLSKKADDKEYALFLHGSIYERQKKYDQAEQLFRQVLAIDSQNAMTLNYLGYMMADHGSHVEEALGYIKRAVQLDPANGAYLDSLGWAYFKMGNYDMAEEQLRKASQHMASDPTVQEHLGDLYQKTGHLKQAAAHWERALEEWAKTVPAEVDQDSVAKTQKKLDAAKVKLARESAMGQQQK